jgi:glucoamylase
VDTANTRDVQYLVADENSFMHEEKRHMKHGVEYSDLRALAYRQTNVDPHGRYRFIKETISDPDAPVVLVHTRFEALCQEADDYRIYTLVAPHIGNQGMGNSARRISVDGRDCLIAERAGKALAVVASIPFLKCSCGFVGASDGWTDLAFNFRMDWEFTSATNGNVALMGELDIPGRQRGGSGLNQIARPYQVIAAYVPISVDLSPGDGQRGTYRAGTQSVFMRTYQHCAGIVRTSPVGARCAEVDQAFTICVPVA